MSFSAVGEGTSRVIGGDANCSSEENGNTITIPVVSIDDTPSCADATYIKMDVEGAELPALKGAISTIRKNKPKLAICIYHSNEEMLSIPEWIHENFPEYKLYIRQHATLDVGETVLYGIAN